MMLLFTVSVGASIKFAIGFENKTFGCENSNIELGLVATHISKVVLAVMSPFKYRV